MEPPKLNLVVLGTTSFPRFAILNRDRYWNGSGWAESRNEAHLFENLEEASTKYRTLADKLNPREFVATVRIRLFDGQDVRVECLAEFLSEFASFTSDYWDMDHVCTDTAITLAVDGDTLKEV